MRDGEEDAGPTPEARGADDSHTVRLTVNGAVATVEVSARWSLADMLRERLGLTGTHVGCEQGVCGTCTVLVDDAPVRSCLMFAVQADGTEVVTVEGSSQEPLLEALREEFVRLRALQCGFCTAGFLMLATGLLREDPNPSDEHLQVDLSSNLCRCTGYAPIVAAVRNVRDSL